MMKGAIDMYQYITIERQYCSGGNEIGRRLAKALNYKLYDHNILVMAAKRLEVPHIYISDLEETGPNSIIFNLSQTPFGGSSRTINNMPLVDRLFYEEKKIIEEVTATDPCVIVGRCAGYILKDHPDCLKVFIHADTDFRIQRSIQDEKLTHEEAVEVLKKTDKRRSGFYTTHSGYKWGDSTHFDICLDSSSLGLDRCVSILADIVGIN